MNKVRYLKHYVTSNYLTYAFKDGVYESTISYYICLHVLYFNLLYMQNLSLNNNSNQI